MTDLRRAKGIFRDPFNPTAEELRIWAYGDYCEPVQDFDLFVIGDPYLALSFAQDVDCPNKDYFYHALCIWVCDLLKATVKVGVENSTDYLPKWLSVAQDSRIEKITAMVEHAREVLRNPSTFDQSKWVEGGEYYSL